MPIRIEALERRFHLVDGTLTVDELRERFTVRSAATYLLIALPDGQYHATLPGEVADVVARLGPEALDRPLALMPTLRQPTRAVERGEMGTGEAERERDRQPRRRLVVLEDAQPIGLLANEDRGGSADGLLLNLFGPYGVLPRDKLVVDLERANPTHNCPFCREQFTYYEADYERGAYCCPHCHQALLDE